MASVASDWLFSLSHDYAYDVNPHKGMQTQERLIVLNIKMKMKLRILYEKEWAWIFLLSSHFKEKLFWASHNKEEKKNPSPHQKEKTKQKMLVTEESFPSLLIIRHCQLCIFIFT